MIPVIIAPEPATFDADVRQPGAAWMAAKGYAGLSAFPAKTKVNALWTKALDDLMSAYDEVCA